MQVWAIKHKLSGDWMPHRMFRSGRGGWSAWEPGSPPGNGYDGFDKHPRVFFTEASARMALTQWLRGIFHQETYGQGFNTEQYLEVRPPAVERRREDMEVVALELTGPGV